MSTALNNTIKSLDRPPNETLFLRALQLLSLDACSDFYHLMRLPDHFGENQRIALQDLLTPYSYEKFPTQQSTRQWITLLFNHYESWWGTEKAQLLGEWIHYGYDANLFAFKLCKLIADIRCGRIQTDLPPRVQRFSALHDLFTYADDEAVELKLNPQQLESEWDLYCWRAQHDPIEDRNTWNPSDWVSSYIRGTGIRLAWANACRTPAPTKQELNDIHLWVATGSSTDITKLPKPDSLGLPPLLLNEYEQRGFISTIQ